MKLIDKDEIMKFPVRLDNYDETNGRRQYVLGIEAVLGYIHEMPTVDAIPVEWVGEWIRMPNTWARIFKKYDEEDDEFLESALHDALYWMIKDWEREKMKVIFRIIKDLDKEDRIEYAKRIRDIWYDTKDLDCMVCLGSDVEVYVINSDSELEIVGEENEMR